jgi:hypothetical protein
MGSTYKILVGTPKRKRSLGRPGCRCKDNIRMDSGEIGWEFVNWIHMVQDMETWSTLLKTVMDLRIFDLQSDY